MVLEDRLYAFLKLRDKLQNLSPTEIEHLAKEARQQNPWFTLPNIKMAIKGIITLLHTESIKKWINSYTLHIEPPKNIGVVMAGNIPLVGFHDFLSILISGHILQAKLSSRDSVLYAYIAKEIISIEPGFSKRIFFENPLHGYDAAIATGSNNTARYFLYHFKKVPHIIRKNRSSCAILSGRETLDEQKKLGVDIFSYFGLGCRNISKLYIPAHYSFKTIVNTWSEYNNVMSCPQYANNYRYQKSLYKVHNKDFLDHKNILLAENKNLHSPIAVLYYEPYHSEKELAQMLQKQENNIQCVASAGGWFPQSVAFGKTQLPHVSEYADHIDTLKFLNSLQ